MPSVTIKTKRAGRESGLGEHQALLHVSEAMNAVRDGNFTLQLPAHWNGIEGNLAGRFNEMLQANRSLVHELARVGKKVRREGYIRHRIALPRLRLSTMTFRTRSVHSCVVRVDKRMPGVSGNALTPQLPRLHGSGGQLFAAEPGWGRCVHRARKREASFSGCLQQPRTLGTFITLCGDACVRLQPSKGLDHG